MANSRTLLNPTMAGWRMAGPGGFRATPEGVIESFGGPGLFWYAEEAFDDFVLTLEWRLTTIEDNSGIFLRCPPLTDSPQPAIDQGYEVQIDERGFDPETQSYGSALHLTGAIYKLAPAIGRSSHPVNQWNLFEIRTNGPIIAVDLNGVVASRLEHAERRRRGHIGLQNHHQGSAVQFRNVRIEASVR